MYKRHIPYLLILAGLLVSLAAQGQTGTTKQDACSDGEVIKRGSALKDAPVVQLADALAAPKLFSGRTVRVEGVVERNCTEKGCWMEIAPKVGAAGLRVVFKDEGFFIPLNSKGMKATAEGQFAVESISKEHADHLIGEGARLKRNPDGTVNQVSFLAIGVELRK
jgi:hypothetical protein